MTPTTRLKIVGDPAPVNGGSGIVHYGNVEVTVDDHPLIGLRAVDFRVAVGEPAIATLDFGAMSGALVDMAVHSVVAAGSRDALIAMGWTPPTEDADA